MSALGILTGILANNIFQSIWLCCIVVEPRHGRKTTAAISVGISFVYTFVALAICLLCFRMFSVPVGIFVGYVVGIVVYALTFCLVLSASHPVKSLFLYTGYYSVYTIILIVVAVVTDTYTLGNGVVWILRAVLNLAVLIWYLFYFKERLFRLYHEMRSNYGVMSIISGMCLLIETLFMFYNMKMGRRELFFDVLLLVSCTFTIAVYVVVFHYMAHFDHITRMKQLQANEKFLQAQIDSYKKMGENAKQTRHDFRHHTMVVMEYAKNKDYQAILSYLSEYDKNERGKYQAAFCRNHAADTVLSAYASRCEQSGIEISADVHLEESEEISDYDLVTILANILENSVNGCMEADGKRRVDISIGPRGSKLVIVCKNACAGDIPFEDGLPKNREREGIGVESILSTAAKYNGVVDFSASDNTFVCQVILNNKKKTDKY
ncbi:MAG: GHKL domain-containing protein [Lachnospiraceae bacterium]|nr:GHKL domain-containing protein [Lachnospiraceae bacterium]